MIFLKIAIYDDLLRYKGLATLDLQRMDGAQDEEISTHKGLATLDKLFFHFFQASGVISTHKGLATLDRTRCGRK